MEKLDSQTESEAKSCVLHICLINIDGSTTDYVAKEGPAEVCGIASTHHALETRVTD